MSDLIKSMKNKLTDEDILSRLSIAKKIACSPVLNSKAKVQLIEKYAGFKEEDLHIDNIESCCSDKKCCKSDKGTSE